MGGDVTLVRVRESPLPELPHHRMVTIPAGQIHMRDDRTKARWTVQLDHFELAVFPVTQALYRAVLGESPASFAGDDLPVESVSWLDAVRFCNALSSRLGQPARYQIDGEEVALVGGLGGYRLPTEAEWAYACRAGSDAPRYGELDTIGWYAGNSGGKPNAVGQKQPNAFGLYDMLGNTWEWCWDQYDPEVYGAYRVFRGGGWADPERGCLATNRRRSHPTFAIDDLGFRVAAGPLP